MYKKPIDITDARALEELIVNTVSRTIREEFIRIGFDINNPIELQSDAHFLRQSRLGAINIKINVVKIFMGSVMTVISLWLYLGFKQYIRLP